MMAKSETARVERNTMRWPVNTQVQHDTNVAAQDIQTAVARLRRLAKRMEREECDAARVAAVTDLANRADLLVGNLYAAK